MLSVVQIVSQSCSQEAASLLGELRKNKGKCPTTGDKGNHLNAECSCPCPSTSYESIAEGFVENVKNVRRLKTKKKKVIHHSTSQG